MAIGLGSLRTWQLLKPFPGCLLRSTLTDYGDDNLSRFDRLSATFMVGMGLHLAAQCRFLLADTSRKRLQLSEALAVLLEESRNPMATTAPALSGDACSYRHDLC